MQYYCKFFKIKYFVIFIILYICACNLLIDCSSYVVPCVRNHPLNYNTIVPDFISKTTRLHQQQKQTLRSTSVRSALGNITRVALPHRMCPGRPAVFVRRTSVWVGGCRCLLCSWRVDGGGGRREGGAALRTAAPLGCWSQRVGTLGGRSRSPLVRPRRVASILALC